MPGTAQDSGKNGTGTFWNARKNGIGNIPEFQGKLGLGKPRIPRKQGWDGMGWGTLVKPQDSRENQDWECQEQPRIPEKQG